MSFVCKEYWYYKLIKPDIELRVCGSTKFKYGVRQHKVKLLNCIVLNLTLGLYIDYLVKLVEFHIFYTCQKV